MKIDVFDSFATSLSGTIMHFDVFVETGTSAQTALRYAQQWLKSINESPYGLKQSHCNYCHTEATNPEIARHIKQYGYFILQMEGCPSPD